MNQSFEELIEENNRVMQKIVMEVMGEIFARMPWAQKFQLSDGTTGYMKKFVDPMLGDDGRGKFGFDIIIEGKGERHLEFFTYHTGGGMSVNNGEPHNV